MKAVFVDLDGTLLQGVDRVTARTIRAFQKIKEKGIIPIIATGRPACEADFAIKAIGADKYLIVMNGLMVYENYQERKVLFESYLSNVQAETILSYLFQEQVFCEIYMGEQSYCQKDNVHLIKDCGMTPEHVKFFSEIVEVVDDVMGYAYENKLHIHKIFASESDPEKLQKIRQQLNQIDGIKTLSSGETYLEILPESADKQRAVRAVREKLGLLPEQIMVIGDSENDLGMFDEAGTCIAMGNAYPEVKEKANYIAPSNMEDGAAWALETLILGESGPGFQGRIETIYAEEIEKALEHCTRQYLTGDLKMPQQLKFLKDENIESGISDYPCYKWEAPHYHTITSEYCYILSGETKYVDLNAGTEYYFKTGDFYVLRKDTPYLQKCNPGCRLFFVKAPGINDKISLEMDQKMRFWCESWENKWEKTS